MNGDFGKHENYLIQCSFYFENLVSHSASAATNLLSKARHYLMLVIITRVLDNFNAELMITFNDMPPLKDCKLIGDRTPSSGRRKKGWLSREMGSLQ